MARIEMLVTEKQRYPLLAKLEAKKDKKGSPAHSTYDIEAEGSGTVALGTIAIADLSIQDEGKILISFLEAEKQTDILDRINSYENPSKQGKNRLMLRSDSVSYILSPAYPSLKIANKRKREIVELQLKEDEKLEPLEPSPVGVKPNQNPPRLRASVALQYPKQNP